MSKLARVRIIGRDHPHFGEVGTVEIPDIAILGATHIFDAWESFIRVRRDGITPKWSHLLLVTLESGIQCFARRSKVRLLIQE